MAVAQTSTCVVTLGGGSSAQYVMQEGNWKVIDVKGKVLVAGSVAAAATVTVKKNVSTGIAPVGTGVMSATTAAGTAVAALQKNSAAGTVFSPTTFTSTTTSPLLAQGDTLDLASDTGGQIEVYVTLQRV